MESNAAVKPDTLPATPTALAADVYSSRIAIFVEADSLMAAELLKDKSADDLAVIGDDANWYRSEAWTLLDSLGIKYVSVKRGPMRFLVDGAVKEYDWKDVDLLWFIVLYDGKKEPKAIPAIEIHSNIAYITQ